MPVQRNSSIDIFRLIASLLVVAIHTSPFKDISSDLYFVFRDVIARIAVPFFFCTTGYYFSKRLEAHKSYKNYLKTLFIPYCFWSFIYAALNTIIHLADHSFTGILDIAEFALGGFLLFGTHEHLWFFPATFISLFVMIALNSFKLLKAFIPLGITVFIFLVLGTAYSNLAPDYIFTKHIEYKIVRSLFVAIPYMALGYLITFIENKPSNKTVNAIFLALAFAVYFCEKYIIRLYHTGRSSVNVFSLYILVAIIMLYLIRNPNYSLHKQADFSRKASSFIYFIHPIIGASLGYIMNVLLGATHETIVYVITCIIAVALSAAVYKRKGKRITAILG